ncbi:gamma-butyrobetaine hydroxylase-like domain-containing protein [Salisaeta longa]|uniref:gamma-butyrobetaine hydroxylase-like domain-containing protein n=1 Tax=Salisaeta longa TaxID=503170 RepID=UPI000416CE34|nr:DUF971 domain-containing protein [Salisaeta longa]
MASPHPQRVSVDIDAQTLTIDWSDGHSSVYPLDGLRRACPCAHCRGAHGAPPVDAAVLDHPARRRWTDVRVETAGSMGLRITWDDGHNDGIYTWERLRALR